MQGAGCGEMSTCKMQGKMRGLTQQFTYTNAPWPDDDHEPGDAWAWDNRSSSSSSSSSSSRTYRLTWHKLNRIASRTCYTNYRKKIKLMGRIWQIKMF